MINTPQKTKTIQGKDLITIGIFSAIYFALNFAVMLCSGFSPYIWILMPGIIALLTGVPYMIMTSKVQKLGAVFTMGLISGLLYFLTGQFTLIILITFVVSCVIAELVRYITKYKGFKGNMLSFVFFSLGMTGSPLPLWVFKDSFLSQIAGQGISESYLNILQKIASTEMLVVLFVAPVIGAVIGAYIAKSLFKKHFKKAGIV
ncbi:MptD family putative ECF transporter S component [Clostridium sp. 'deep sea']|uniref:MptD family putative ECF transporter S component n=1 Tax=Clostridium sp. 'deep sea' TaxID=2779445 RepID=UPI0018967D02|nr:MptD family putative ECF transporter S component [Clostridium sp. 'deep sea']QOR35074.1 MptD family putative ECF transporter S component [Clostridium sp. 'deep sea']